MNDFDYMKRAIELAVRGRGMTNPNPVVGAVIVKGGRIIGEGWHQKCGGLHAERNALASLTESAQGADLYVTLEPCCHYGKTPPCTDAILGHGIRRVVIGSRDPNPKVAGQGVKLLRDAGVIVEEDFMREECDRLNPVFFHYITTGMPYVIMKYAMTADGKTATKTGASKWITGEAARGEVHKLRSECMGIMAGIGTVLADDPLLNVRLAETPKQGTGTADNFLQNVRIAGNFVCGVGGNEASGRFQIPDNNFEESLENMQMPGAEGKEISVNAPQDSEADVIPVNNRSAGGKIRRNPLRIICDSHLRIPLDSQICRTAKEYPTLVVCAAGQQEKIRQLADLGIEVLCLPGEDGRVDLKELMRCLGKREIDSILLEGGGGLNDSALRAGIVQEIRVFIAPKLFGGAGAKTPVGGIGVELPDQAVRLELEEIRKIGEDLMLVYRVREKNLPGSAE